MKKLLIGMIGVLLMSQTQAQDIKPYNPSFVAKWVPSSLFFGKIGIGTEYNFKKKRSVTFNFGLPSEYELTQNIDNKDRTLKMKTTSVMAGYRMYLGKRPMTAFYFEPYVKYVKNTASTNTDFDISGTTKPFLLSTTYSGFGIGAQLGLQMMIAKCVVLDWYILGPEANSSKFDLDAQETGSGAAWDATAANDAKQEIDNFVKDVPIVGSKTTVTVNSSARNVHAAYKGFLPGFRTGLSLGIRLGK